MERTEVAVMHGYLDARIPGHLSKRQRDRRTESKAGMKRLVDAFAKDHPALASSVIRSPSPDGPLAVGFVT